MRRCEARGCEGKGPDGNGGIRRTGKPRAVYAHGLCYEHWQASRGRESWGLPLGVVQCGCGKRYDAKGWAKLKSIGVQRLKEYGMKDLEMRNCSCGSTLAKELDQ